jgi:crotonobetainyl-CoA:carnitine CoA-transferase CaiB-like acyl-CoA transferase
LKGGAALRERRVLEIADEKGVYCGKLLADMGADVIKVERPGGDATRDIPPFWRDEPHPDGSLFFLYMNTSKRGITLDLEHPRARDLFLRMVERADLVVETLAPGRLERLGLGYEALRAANPKLVLTSITGFGQRGPWRDCATQDLVAGALGGALHVTGHAEDPPVTLAGSQSWISTSTCAAVASLIALHHASRTGRGQHVDISAEEVVTSVTHVCGVGKWLDDGLLASRFGTGLFASVPSGAYRCTDGLVYLMVNRPAHWKALAAWIHEVTGNREVLDPMFEGPSSVRQPHRELLDIFIGELTGRFTVDYVYREGQRRHLAFTPVSRAADVVGDPHLAAREYFQDLEHGYAGVLAYPGAPYRHAVTPWRMSRPAPQVGEHNVEVYVGELGVTRRDLSALRTASAI